MFRDHNFDLVRRLLADQFEAESAHYLYKKNQKGAAIRVSGAERDVFITTFNRRLRFAMWGIVIATLLLISFLSLRFPISGADRLKSQCT